MPWSGRPRSTTPAEDRYLRITARRNPEDNATQLRHALLQATGRAVTTQTVRNRLLLDNSHPRKPLRVLPMTRLHRGTRYRWDRERLDWNMAQWRQILFSDVCRICLMPDNRRRRVWRAPGKAMRLRYTVPRFQQGGGSVMFWADIMYGCRTPLSAIERTLTSA